MANWGESFGEAFNTQLKSAQERNFEKWKIQQEQTYQRPLQQAQIGGLQSESTLRGAQASAIPSEIALRQQQAGAIPSEVALREAQAQNIPAELAQRQPLVNAQVSNLQAEQTLKEEQAKQATWDKLTGLYTAVGGNRSAWDKMIGKPSSEQKNILSSVFEHLSGSPSMNTPKMKAPKGATHFSPSQNKYYDSQGNEVT